MHIELISDYSAQLVFFLQTKVSAIGNGDKRILFVIGNYLGQGMGKQPQYPLAVGQQY